MRRLLAGLLCVAGLAANPAMALDQSLIDAAKNEGKVVWYVSFDENQLARPLDLAFEKKYPGIHVQIVPVTATYLVIKLVGETKGGQIRVDEHPGGSLVWPVTKPGASEKCIPEAAKNCPPELKDADGLWVADALTFLVAAVNAEIVSAGSEPKTYRDLPDLDALLRDAIQGVLKSLQSRLGVTTIYVTHDQSEDLEMSDLVAVMQGGLIIQIGTPQELHLRPAKGFVSTFTGSANVLGDTLDAHSPDGALGTVSLTGGHRLTCWFTRSMSASEPVAVSIRPADIRLSSSDAAQGHINKLSGKVSSAGFLGHIAGYMVQVGSGLLLHASIGSQTILQSGAQVAVEIRFESSLALAADDVALQGRQCNNQAAA